MKKTTFPLVIGIIILTSCNNVGRHENSKNKLNSPILPYHIDLEKNLKNTRSVPLSSIGKKLEYIPLETNPTSLIGRIDGLGFTTSRLIFSEFYIFISDGHKLLQFERSGKFVRQIGSEGRGPEQYTELIDFCIDEKKEIIYILGARNIMEFDFNSQFKRSLKLPYLSVQFMLNDTNHFMFYMGSFPVQTFDPVYSWIVTDLQGNPTINFLNYHKRVNKPGLRIGWTPLYSFNETALFMEYCADSLFYLKNLRPEPYATFNLGDLRMDPDPVLNSIGREDINRLNQKLWTRFINENNKCLFLTLGWGFSDSSRYCVFNKQTSEITFLKHNSFINDLDGGPSFWPKYIYNDSIMIDFIYADKLLSIINKNQSGKSNDNKSDQPGRLEMLSKQLTETSNPVLIVVR